MGHDFFMAAKYSTFLGGPVQEFAVFFLIPGLATALIIHSTLVSEWLELSISAHRYGLGNDISLLAGWCMLFFSLITGVVCQIDLG